MRWLPGGWGPRAQSGIEVGRLTGILDPAIDVDSRHPQQVRVLGRLPLLRGAHAILLRKRLQRHEVLDLAAVGDGPILLDSAPRLQQVHVEEVPAVLFKDLHCLLSLLP